MSAAGVVSGRSVRMALASVLAAGFLLAGRPAAAEAGWINHENDAPVRAAIIEAVHTRMGASVDVAIGDLTIRAVANVRLTAPLAAVPDAGARTGGFMRFVIYDGRTFTTSPRRVGVADAEVFVVTEQLQARHAIGRGSVIALEDVEIIRDDVGRVPLRPIPTARGAIGARALRAIAAGDRLSFGMLSAPALVKSGDEVQTVVRVGSLEARGTAVAAQTGALGAEIRVVNVTTRRSLRARVIGTREVEVVP
jgi:flagella basal body P-ring formation protein FlgA